MKLITARKVTKQRPLYRLVGDKEGGKPRFFRVKSYETREGTNYDRSRLYVNGGISGNVLEIDDVSTAHHFYANKREQTEKRFNDFKKGSLRIEKSTRTAEAVVFSIEGFIKASNESVLSAAAKTLTETHLYALKKCGVNFEENSKGLSVTFTNAVDTEKYPGPEYILSLIEKSQLSKSGPLIDHSSNLDSHNTLEKVIEAADELARYEQTKNDTHYVVISKLAADRDYKTMSDAELDQDLRDLYALQINPKFHGRKTTQEALEKLDRDIETIRTFEPDDTKGTQHDTAFYAVENQDGLVTTQNSAEGAFNLRAEMRKANNPAAEITQTLLNIETMNIHHDTIRAYLDCREALRTIREGIDAEQAPENPRGREVFEAEIREKYESLDFDAILAERLAPKFSDALGSLWYLTSQYRNDLETLAKKLSESQNRVKAQDSLISALEAQIASDQSGHLLARWHFESSSPVQEDVLEKAIAAEALSSLSGYAKELVKEQLAQLDELGL